jgi:predicted phosphodiesterase
VALKKFLFASDLHGDLQESEAVDALLDFTKQWKPHIRIFGGDLFDLRPLRRGCSKEERAETIQYDLDAGIKFLSRWKPHHWLRGNHDERLWEFAEHDGIEGEYAQQGVASLNTLCKRLKIATKPYCKRRGVLELGNLKCLHGYFSGVYAARAHAQVYGSCLFGHIHAIDTANVPGLERREARSVGCLCKLDMPWNARIPATLRHQHGFAYGVFDEKSGEFELWQSQKTKMGWVAATKLWMPGRST